MPEQHLERGKTVQAVRVAVTPILDLQLPSRQSARLC